MTLSFNGIYNQATGVPIFLFDTYIENTYHNSNGVAFEPLENGTFSSDSKQNTPFGISITAIKTIEQNTGETPIGISIPATKPTVDQIKTALESLVQSTTLVTVTLQPMIQSSIQTSSQYSQLGKSYQNLSLVSLDYQNTPDQLEFRPVMIFQQIRMTTTSYTASQNTANPDNTSVVNQGQVQPTTVDSSILFNQVGEVPL